MKNPLRREQTRKKRKKEQSAKAEAKATEGELPEEEEEEDDALLEEAKAGELEESLQLDRKDLHRYCMVQPLGNLLFSSSSHNIRDSGLGSFFSLLGDELLCDILGLLEASDMVSLSLVSKAFYVFSHQDFLWRNLVLEKFGGDFRFQRDWRCTYASSVSPCAPLPWPPIKVSSLFVSSFLLLLF